MRIGAGHDVRTAAINATTTTGDNTIVAADVNGNRIKVIGYVLVATAATTVTWKHGTTALSGAMSLPANGGISAPLNETTAWFSTAANVALVMTLGAGAVQGHVTYVVEP
jgi:hypothetical protein